MKKVTTLLGATLTKDEVDEFMKEADVVCKIQIALVNWQVKSKSYWGGEGKKIAAC